MKKLGVAAVMLIGCAAEAESDYPEVGYPQNSVCQTEICCGQGFEDSIARSGLTECIGSEVYCGEASPDGTAACCEHKCFEGGE